VINTPSIPPFADDVDVAVVSHNGRDTLPRLLECLMASRTPRERIVIYDVGSTDGTREWIADAWPEVTVRRLDNNVGPDPGRNWALRAATPAAIARHAEPSGASPGRRWNAADQVRPFAASCIRRAAALGPLRCVTIGSGVRAG